MGEDSQEEAGTSAASMTSASSGMRIGFALLPKKVSRYMTPVIKAAALAEGIEMCLIDITRPLSTQGPFNAIIHKLQPNLEWERDLLEYSRLHPDVRVIDSVTGITTLRNRVTMLSVLRGNDIVMQDPQSDTKTYRVKAPPQVVIPEDMPLADAEHLMKQSGMRPPLVIKPVWSDGREGSHGLAVVHDMASLSNLLCGSVQSSVKPPAVIQEFVEHGGVLFKVYVVGSYTAVCKRPSLGDNYLGNDRSAGRKGIMQLPRISCKSVGSDLSLRGDLSSSPEIAVTSMRRSRLSEMSLREASAMSPLPPPGLSPGPLSGLSPYPLTDMSPMLPSAALSPLSPSLMTPGPASPIGELPPEWFTHRLADELRRRLDMHLFNFDLLRLEQGEPGSAGDSGGGSEDESLYYIIDINYFPGVDKIPDFERNFVEFLQSACREIRSSNSKTGS